MHFRILHYDTLDSTNNLAISFARENAREGTVVASEYQTHGRGRFKRRWRSPRGKGLLFSIILRPNLKSSSASILTHVAAQSVADVLKNNFKLPAKLKKPNDVLVNGKKIAGILTESSAYHHRLEYVVIGIGLNINTQSKELLKMATSLYIETKRKIQKEEVLKAILKTFKARYEHLNGRAVSAKNAQKAEVLQHA